MRSRTLKIFSKNSNHHQECFGLATISKQLYNVGIYELRQSLIKENIFLTNKEVYQRMKLNENWSLLPRKVSNQVWKQVCGSWGLWIKSIKRYKKDQTGYKGRPKMPGYNKSLNLVTYEQGALGVKGLKKGEIRLSQTDMVVDISTIEGKVVEVKIIPRNDKFLVKVVYREEVDEQSLDYDRIAGIDLGLNNLMAIATNRADIPAQLVKGGALKSINQFWNKYVSRLKAMLASEVYISPKINQLIDKRNAKVDDVLHKTSRYVVDWLVKNEIGVLIIGKNKQWKDLINIGKRNNQNFVQVPHAKLIDMLTYKFEAVGGIVVIVEESYTSKASALDLDSLPKFKKGITPIFSGRRIKRGLYKTGKGIKINADVNGALNIIRKVVGNSLLGDLIEDVQFIHHCRQPESVILVS